MQSLLDINANKTVPSELQSELKETGGEYKFSVYLSSLNRNEQNV
jgi:hypothetical protein